MQTTYSHLVDSETWLLKEKYNGIQAPGFAADCERLRMGEPLAYVIGWTPFLDTKIYLDSRPLIPRPETECWVGRFIDEQKNLNTPLHILDLCAGSGCIGVALLASLPHVTVDFAEIEARHHSTIKRNLDENEIKPNRARIFGGSLFNDVTDTYNAILTNPPYIDPRRIDKVQESVRAYEPKEALFGGADGLAFIQSIINDAPKHLTPDGVLIIEHEPEQVEAIEVHGSMRGFKSINTSLDQYNVARTTTLTDIEQK